MFKFDVLINLDYNYEALHKLNFYPLTAGNISLTPSIL